MLTRIVCSLLTMLVATAASAAGAGHVSLTTRVADIAAQFSSLGVADALYDRLPRLNNDLDPVQKSLHKLDDGQQLAEIQLLLRHKESKVRTMGIIIGFRECRIDILPDIAQLVGDPELTFPQPNMVATSFPAKPPPLEPVSVKQYATAVVNAYIRHSDELSRLERSAKLSLSDSASLADAIRVFAAARDKRLSTAGLLVAMDQATGQSHPLQPERAARVESVLDRLLLVPMPRRFFAAVALNFDQYRQQRYSPDFLLSLARQVPRNARLEAIHNRRAIDDQDLPLGAGSDYILDHAADLLHTSDVDMLLQTVTPATGPPRVRCATAAAQLAPSQAEKILISAFANFATPSLRNDRTQLALALARLGTDKGNNEAIDWFFREAPEPGAFGFGRDAFLEGLHAFDSIRFRQVVGPIIRDSRLSTLGPSSTRSLILAAQGYFGRSLANEEDIRVSFGIDEAQSRGQFGPLLQWQKSLRETVDEWDQ